MGKAGRKPIIKERMVPFSRAGGDFDLKFWRRAGAAMRFAAAWKMVEDFFRIRGINGHKLRLQRSVQTVKQT